MFYREKNNYFSKKKLKKQYYDFLSNILKKNGAIAMLRKKSVS